MSAAVDLPRAAWVPEGWRWEPYTYDGWMWERASMPGTDRVYAARRVDPDGSGVVGLHCDAGDVQVRVYVQPVAAVVDRAAWCIVEAARGLAAGLDLEVA